MVDKIYKRLTDRRRKAGERKVREEQARRAKTYVVRDGRGRAVASH
ncbi:MAG TPA: hypothetical protein VN618_01140 [Solirubrobacteraceae bacterium]|nr:hypothetical protein [Solirubrobacteraceae bacterium]